MERPPRDFKGIWIPKDIWCSEQFSLIEKILFAEIHSLDNEHGCYASNRYFADFFRVSERQIRTHIASLKDKGFITVSIMNFNQRVIRVVGKYARVRGEDLRRLEQQRRQLIHTFDVRALQVGRKLPRG